MLKFFECLKNKTSSPPSSRPILADDHEAGPSRPHADSGEGTCSGPSEDSQLSEFDDATTSSKVVLTNSRRIPYFDLARATGSFSSNNLLGKGRHGSVYRGRLPSGDIVAVKKLKDTSPQGEEEFANNVLMFTTHQHPMLVTFLAYGQEGNQRFFVFEYMEQGSLQQNLFDLPPNREPLGWERRMKIAADAAKALEYLHDQEIIHRDVKAANILLDDGLNAKLSDFGTAKLGRVHRKRGLRTANCGSLGYCAPEYISNRSFTIMSDVYSFAVVLLELISGRRAFDKKRENDQLVRWAWPFLRKRKEHHLLVDPLLVGHYPARRFASLCYIIADCLELQPRKRPPIHDVTAILGCLAPSTPSSATGFS